MSYRKRDTTFLFRDGRYHARLDCELTPTALQATIERALAAPAQENPSE